MKSRQSILALAGLLATASAPVAVPVVADNAAIAETAIGQEDHTGDAADTAGARTRRAMALPPFAPQFSDMAPITGPAGWQAAGHDGGWPGLIAAKPATRQAARWAYATHQISLGRGPEALGALQVMGQDEPDLALIPSYQLALGTALTMLDRSAEALAALSGAALQPNSEACVWRMMALIRSPARSQALGQLRCALPALNARSVRDRAPFLLAAARAAADAGQPAGATQLLAAIAEGDPAANVLRGRAELALGHRQQGMLLLARAERRGNREQQLDAQLSIIEEQARQGALPAAAISQLRQIRFVWRGGDVELRALQLSYAIARRTHDLGGALEAGATLFRYFGGGPDRVALIAELRETLAATLAPDNPQPLDQVAGLYWDYRDLSPAGAEGDLLVTQLADRLQAAGLYERAAELLDHQLQTRTRDIAQGPLSARVASLFILAGKPQRALAAIRATEGNNYPDDMLWARHRVEAVALDQLGRANEALAVLQDVPDGEAIRGELYWRRQDWKALAAMAPQQTGNGAMSDVAQARVLRLAVAFAMLGRESDLARLRAQYSSGFAKLPTAAAFDALTSPVQSIDPATISAAMSAIPAASPAGSIADLIDTLPQSAAKSVPAALH